MRLLSLLFIFVAAATASAKSFVYVSNGGDKTISLFAMEEDQGTLELIKTIELESAPGPITLSPDQQFAYVSTSRPNQLLSFAVNADTGELKPIDKSPLDATSCFVYCDPTGKWLLNAYYGGSKVTVHPLDGGQIGQLSQTIPTAKNAHCIRTDSTNRFALVPHTGPNKVFQFRFDPASGQLTANDPLTVDAPGKNEPRHLQFHPTLPLVFSSDENNDRITSYDY
ncbi:MAG: lactonase family protein, partial [Blastopirellula sp. JB062]